MRVLLLCSGDTAASAAAAFGVTGPCSLSVLLCVLLRPMVVPSAVAPFGAALADALMVLSPSVLACCCRKALMRPSLSVSLPIAERMRANFSACCCFAVDVA